MQKKKKIENIWEIKNTFYFRVEITKNIFFYAKRSREKKMLEQSNKIPYFSVCTNYKKKRFFLRGHENNRDSLSNQIKSSEKRGTEIYISFPKFTKIIKVEEAWNIKRPPPPPLVFFLGFRFLS